MGYLIALRIKPLSTDTDDVKAEGKIEDVQLQNYQMSMASLEEAYTEDQLKSFLTSNFGLLERIRGKKQSVVMSTIKKLMRKAKMSVEIADEIAEMVYSDL